MKSILSQARMAALKLALGTCSLLTVMIWTGCRSDEQKPREETETPMPDSSSLQKPIDTATGFAEIEEKMRSAPAVQIKFDISSKGAVASSLAGALELQAGNLVSLEASGSFAGKPFELQLQSDGKQMRGGSRPEAFEFDTPPALNESILVGMTRMGLLHNLARLTADAPPDHAEGGVTTWVTVSEFKSGGARIIETERAWPITFSITVAGEHSGEGTLWMGETTGLPIERTQTVFFEAGRMDVVERYETIKLGQPLDTDHFRLPE